MATTAINSLTLFRHNHSLASTQTRTRYIRPTIRSMGPDLLGDMGARDPFPAELASNFGDKVVGNTNTEHKILIPNTSILSLSQQSILKVSPDESPMTLYEAKQLLCKVVGWRVSEEGGGMKIRCVWKVKDYRCGAELISRIAVVSSEEGHFPAMHLEKNGQVTAELWTEEIGGLSFNDFILAAKIDLIKTSDLVSRRRVWA